MNENYPEKKYLIVVVGPTAVGKTQLCVSLAKFLQTEIISADSRQFYNELEIGTAKVSAQEMQGIKHHFVGHISIQDEMNTGIFERESLQLLDKLFTHHRHLIMTGGSGLYIKAVCEGIDEMPEVDIEIRNSLNQLHTSRGIEFLQNELKKIDPEYFAKVDLQNPQRLIRALEVYESTGKTYSSFRKNEPVQRNFEIIKIGLNRDREELYERINHRMDLMLNNGLLEEAKSFYYYKNLNALKTVGYSEIYGFLNGEYNWDSCVELLKRNSRRYAKRQLTWFRKDQEIEWFHPDEFDKIKDFIINKLK